jgi:hypothetical protein
MQGGYEESKHHFGEYIFNISSVDPFSVEVAL